MKIMKTLLVVSLALSAFAWTLARPASAGSAMIQNQGSTALERGYRTGYSDGYQSGYADQASQAPRDYASKEDYKRADRAYVDVWGPIEDYRDGYQQGFEIGYSAGFEKQQFNSAQPAGFKRRGAVTPAGVDNAPAVDNGTSSNNNTTSTTTSTTSTASVPADATVAATGSLSIPKDTVLLVELENSLSTDVSHAGDRFQARVIEPQEYAGGVIDGRITQLQRAGKVKGTAEIQLAFEQLRMPDNRTTNIHAEVVELLPDAASTGVGDIDREGGVRGTDSTKNDVSKVGAATGIGAIIGVIAGGGKGAAIGAAIGGSVGTAGVLSSRGKDIRLARGQKLRIRTSTTTNLQ